MDAIGARVQRAKGRAAPRREGGQITSSAPQPRQGRSCWWTHRRSSPASRSERKGQVRGGKHILQGQAGHPGCVLRAQHCSDKHARPFLGTAAELCILLPAFCC